MSFSIVLAVKSAGLPHVTRSGLLVGDVSWLYEFRPYFLPRDEAEVDSNYRQVITYTVFLCGDSVLTGYRSGLSGEPRLRHRRTLGFGGHVEACDVTANLDGTLDMQATIRRAQLRELNEELSFGHVTKETPVGLLLQYGSQVSAVHLGLVSVIELATPEATSREAGITDCRFVRIEDIPSLYSECESWAHSVGEWLVETRGAK